VEPAAAVQTGQTVASVDLGSNSFHMLVARVVGDEIHVVDRMRSRVGLAEGLGDDKHLTSDVRTRALEALSIFGQRLLHMPSGSVRAVGTNTLRQAKNGREFLDEAEAVLGHPIEVISGREEARLVYLGVAHSVEDDGRRRLVVDIGGGSTELIIGEHFEPLEADSLYMGCVTFSRFFPRGRITTRNMDEAIVAAMLELTPIERRYEALGWSQVVGSSGTVTSIEAILRANGWSQHGITEKGLKRLRKALVAAGSVDAIDLAGMPADRAPVLPAGVAILSALFSRLSIERMQASQGALKEGLVYDLLGRIRKEDVRDQTIRAYSERYHVDQEQARRVAVTAQQLLEQVAAGWDLPMPDAERLLEWAARLHEVGKAISYSGYHKHGGYIVAHSEMPGFSRSDQTVLAALVAGHRGKIRPSRFEDLPVERAERALRLGFILRIAVLLNRSRTRRAVPKLRFRARKRAIHLGFPQEWLDDNPLTRTDLENESRRLQKAGYVLAIE
jgi:exopolyphosphatase/guanosine-5'-triphosphate,3'-diphosphate pyrophosphatase